MTASFSPDIIAPWLHTLHNHPVYAAVRTLPQLRLFMAHHVFPVWDFMSLLKSLQHSIAPVQQPWAPGAPAELRRFINEIVLGEESDEAPPDATGRARYLSHFELYAQAMQEIGADPAPALALAQTAARQGLETALRQHPVPPAARAFMRTTFDFIATGQAHVVAAAFALGREEVIPAMFRALLNDIGIRPEQAPAFHFYLHRHIHLDEGHHAPLAMKLVNQLVANDPVRLAQAQQAAIAAVKARIALWDGVLEALNALPADATEQASDFALA